MGFAGQVFAARVAVGLALPTPSQLESSGGMIAGFANKMYRRLRSQQLDNAKQGLKNSQQQLADAQNVLSAAQASNKSKLASAAKDSIDAISTAYSKTPKIETAAGMKDFLAAAQAAPGQMASKMEPLFANVNADSADGVAYSQLIKNLMDDTTGADAALIQWMESRQKSLKMELEEQQSGTATDRMSAKEMDDLELKIEQGEHHLDTMKQHTTFKTNNVIPAMDAEEKALKDVEKAEKGVVKAGEILNKTNIETAKGTEHLGRTINRAAFQMQTTLINSIKESVALLTAFYYKLNQNTQELIAFERELKNANSVFGLTNSQLFDVGETVTQFGQEFGHAMQNGAEGLYQLASAGVTAEEALAILPETLKLSMAVQGDHNTISKLTAQTLFGFEMSMEQAGEVTDKFAHAIQKSLIEYQDLASAVKFALPFFTSTGQSIDQLLGALQVLTNRALEAGIAGRGLRQGVAELAESIGDATANFHAMGVAVTDEAGNMLQLTEIASNFHAVLEEGVINDTELLTSLIQDLNVRGATAFVHLVQASDEFTDAVKDLENAGGELDEMVRIQNESLQAQIQILGNNIQAIFFLRDANYEGTEYMNAFHEAVVRGVESLQGLLVELNGSTYALTAFGQAIQDIAVEGVQNMVILLEDLVKIVKDFSKEGLGSVEMLKVLLVPLQVMLKIVNALGPQMVKFLITMRLMLMVFPVMTLVTTASAVATLFYAAAKGKANLAEEENLRLNITQVAWLTAIEHITWANVSALLWYIPLKIKSAQATLAESAADKLSSFWKIFWNAAEKKGIFYRLWNIKVSKTSMALKIKEFVIDKARTVGMITGMKWRSANLAVEWKTIFATMWKNKLKTIEMLLEATGVMWLSRKIGLNLVWNKLIALGNFMLGRKLAMTRTEIVLSKLTWIWKKLINKAMWQQIALTAAGAIGWSIFWIAATGGIIVLIAFFVVLAKKLNDQFDIITQFKIFFQHIINMIGWYVQLWIDAGVALADWAMNGTNVFLRFGLFVKHVFLMVAYYIDIAAEKLADFIKDAKDFFSSGLNPWGNVPYIPLIATGKANVYPRQYGGSAYSQGGGAYIVGEKGPELFVPRSSGQIIPNKDLNSGRTNRLYDQSMGSQGITAGSVIRADKLIVNDLKTRLMRTGAAKLGIDIF